MRLVTILKKVYFKVYQRLRPVAFARLAGVTFGAGTLHLYGRVEWGSEPWLITLGRNVHITDGVKFLTHDGGTLLYRDRVPDLEITKPITVGDNVYIGNNVLLLPGVKVGSDVVIGAGAVVTHDIPDHSVAVGVPAKVIKSTDAYLAQLERESLHLGHLHGKEKDRALRAYYHYTGNAMELHD